MFITPNLDQEETLSINNLLATIDSKIYAIGKQAYAATAYGVGCTERADMVFEDLLIYRDILTAKKAHCGYHKNIPLSKIVSQINKIVGYTKAPPLPYQFEQEEEDIEEPNDSFTYTIPFEF